MNHKYDNINDSEIRVISSETNTNTHYWCKRHKRTLLLLLTISIVVVILAVVLGVLKTSHDQGMNIFEKKDNINILPHKPETKAYVEMTDTIIKGIPLSIFIPRFAVAELQFGNETRNDASAILAAQAADVRRDNGEIVGAYVLKGNLMSKGLSKAGFCAIINGTPIIGVSDATPYLEQAIETNGYFFRQYPLVVGGQVVENKPKGKSNRKALAEWNGEIAVIISKKNLTFHEFSQALVNMGVSNAIYLVGSSSYGFAVDALGNRIEFGNKKFLHQKNTNYIVWK